MLILNKLAGHNIQVNVILDLELFTYSKKLISLCPLIKKS